MRVVAGQQQSVWESYLASHGGSIRLEEGYGGMLGREEGVVGAQRSRVPEGGREGGRKEEVRS